MFPLFLLLIVIVGALLWTAGVYNGLTKLKNHIKEAWSEIDVQLKRRHDLIPNLVESVKGYMKHEKDLLENITKARSQAVDAQKTGDKKGLIKLEDQLGGMLGKLQIAVEAYPDLKADSSVSKLMEELSETENKIEDSRKNYNSLVRQFNTKKEVFPNNLFIKDFKFEEFEFFVIEDEQERKNPEVKF